MECEHARDFEHRLTETDARSKSNTKRIDELTKRQDDLDKMVSSVAAIAQKQADMDTDLKEIKKDVKILAEKPAKKWDGLIEKVVSALAGAIVAYLLMKAGIG